MNKLVNLKFMIYELLNVIYYVYSWLIRLLIFWATAIAYCIDHMQLCAYLCIHVLTIKCIRYIFVARVANVWYDILLFALFCTAILSLQYILLTSVYFLDVTALYNLMQWFSGEILNSSDTRKPKTDFCQYYRGYQNYP